MDLNLYFIKKMRKFNATLEHEWQHCPLKYKEIQTLLFFQAYHSLQLTHKNPLDRLQLHSFPTLAYYHRRIEQYIHTPTQELFPSSFHRPYEQILNDLKYLNFHQAHFETYKQIENIRDLYHKIALPSSCHDIYRLIQQYLHISLDYLADAKISIPVRNKLIYQWQSIQNLETEIAYISLDKIQKTLSLYQQKSIEDQYLSLILEKENQRIEFKERTTDLLSHKKSDKWLKACFGFMNTRKGYVFIGIADDLQIVGIEQELRDYFNNSLDLMKRSLIDKLAHESNKLSNIFSTLEEIKIQGKTILVFKCNKADRPLYYKGELYMRTNGQTTRVPPELVASFREEFCY